MIQAVPGIGVVKYTDDVIDVATNLGKVADDVVEEGLETLSKPNSNVLRKNLEKAGEGAYHPSLHTDEYYRTVTEMLSQAKSKEDAIDILSDIAEQLKNGTFKY